MSRKPPTSLSIAGTRMHAVDLRRSVDTIAGWIDSGERRYVVAANAHTIVETQHDAELRLAVDGAGLVVPDGLPLVWLARHKGIRSVGQVRGAALTEALLTHGLARGYRHFFYGGTPELLLRLRRELAARAPAPCVVGMHAPSFGPQDDGEMARDVQTINRSRCDVLWVGLGCPKQELWMARARPMLACRVALGVGAAFDFLAGAKPVAPAWMSRSGLEWLFRLASEPRRLWPRYRRVVPQFAALAARELLR